MGSEMTSRERVNNAIEFKEVDRVPILFRSIECMSLDRPRELLDLGADDIIRIGPPPVPGPEVRVRSWREEAEPYPILHTEWSTPAGALHASARMTEDWQPAELPLYSDHQWSRGLDFPVKSEADLAALDYILADPFDCDTTQHREACEATVARARELGVAVWANVSASTLFAMGLMGGHRAMYAPLDEPEFFEELIERVGRRTRRQIEWLLALEVDIFYRSGCYETVDLYSPDHVRHFFMPQLEADLELIHGAGAKLHNFAQTGVMPFLDDYAAMGLDLLSSLDVKGTNPMDLAETKSRIGDRVALMGGVDNRRLFEQASAEEMDGAVRDTLEIMAPGGGYILSTCGMIFPHAKPENVIAFIEAGRRYGRLLS